MSAVKLFRVTNSISRKNLKITCYIVDRSYCKKTYKCSYSLLERQLNPSSYIKESKCFIHTSKHHRIPAFVAIVIRPAIRITAILFGKALKRWFETKSPDEKENFFEWLRENKNVFTRFLGVYFIIILLFYITHLEYNTMINRTQFIALNKKQREVLAEIVYKSHLEEFKKKILPKTNAVYTNLLKVTTKLINANKDLPVFKDKKWTLTVIDANIENAYVLPGGNIFVFLGLLSFVDNDDQLAIILSHEMAHSILNHSYEQISRGIITELFLAIPIALIWAIFPDVMAGILTIFGEIVVKILHTLPQNRAEESEADLVGLFIAARACIDIREAVVFWGSKRALEDVKIQMKVVSWLSTHPNHGYREKMLYKLMPEAIGVRKKVGCPLLNPEDPIKAFYKLSPQEQAARYLARSIRKKHEIDKNIRIKLS